MYAGEGRGHDKQEMMYGARIFVKFIERITEQNSFTIDELNELLGRNELHQFDMDYPTFLDSFVGDK